MRLLEFCGSGDLYFSQDFTDNIPIYVILSHAWRVDEDEATFNDIRSGSGKSKAGYDKIHVCMQQARKNGLRYFWVDTCCI